MRALGAILAAGPPARAPTDWHAAPPPATLDLGHPGLHAEIVDDPDFGALLVLRRGETARAVCLLPAPVEDLDAALDRVVPHATPVLRSALATAVGA
jgi:hypothetical protein